MFDAVAARIARAFARTRGAHAGGRADQFGQYVAQGQPLIYDLARTPAILDYVEDLIGPDFFQWGGGFFVKYPGEGNFVLASGFAVLAAFAEKNDHRIAGLLRRDPRKRRYAGAARQPSFGTDSPSRCERRRIHVGAGDRRRSDRRGDGRSNRTEGRGNIPARRGVGTRSWSESRKVARAVLTMRFSPTEVKADLGVWSTFESSMARGVDRYTHNPEARIPSGDACPVRSFQHSSTLHKGMQ